MASLGIYQVNPASDQYLLTSPLFDEYEIKLNNGKQFKTITHRRSASALYITSIKYNGHVYTKNYLTYAMIMQGGILEIFMTEKPNLTWGTKPADQPASITN